MIRKRRTGPATLHTILWPTQESKWFVPPKCTRAWEPTFLESLRSFTFSHTAARRSDPTNVKVNADSASLDARGFVLLDDFALVPHFEPVHDCVDYDVDHERWRILMKGHNGQLFWPKSEG